jgi:purine-nucleoside phosphorylase
MMYDKTVLNEATESFLKFYDKPIDWVMVLGSGLSQVGEYFDVVKEIDTSEIKHIKRSRVAGHKGRFLVAKSGNKTVLIMQGRVHLYEGYSAFEVTLPVAIFGEVGIKNIILTNAAGGSNPDYVPGDIMAITDHINMQGTSPLMGIEDNTKFLDLSEVYDKKILDEMSGRFKIRKGVYCAGLGPQYETPAEVRFLQKLGADAVGMSTVLEAIMARYYGMRVAGFSMITNFAAGISKEPLSHSEVVEIGRKCSEQMLEIVKATVEL